MELVFRSEPPIEIPSVMTAARTISHPTIIVRRRRAAKAPSRYRSVLMTYPLSGREVTPPILSGPLDGLLPLRLTVC
ncbi:hypothetical protein [Streptacidiphilus carbonis]|jgi:hypothetical protein|uniref:hypothetical protein n=1 Tax=Streptacidiphilus carbonis TaxID=105422 RepID=UPI00126A60D0|nr:hypothetical protein [Streptacidiphilus carbonis]